MNPEMCNVCCEEFQNAIDECAFKDMDDDGKFYFDGEWHPIIDDCMDDQTKISFRVDYCPFCGQKV